MMSQDMICLRSPFFIIQSQDTVKLTTDRFLMHLLDPAGDKTLLPRLVEELKTTRAPDGKLDISALTGLPLFNSMWQEILRLYTDVLVTRDTKEDLTLPFDGGKKSMLFRAGSVIMAPSFLGHHDAKAWTEGAPCGTFYAERFLRDDAVTGKKAFSLTGANGKLFPFGGGKTICPGRVFAKQEVRCPCLKSSYLVKSI
jgi:cytochrome P450